MPIFYFHIQKPGEQLIKDDEGIELENHDAVRAEAIQAARELIAEATKLGTEARQNCFVITDHQGSEVMSVQFAEAIQRSTPGVAMSSKIAEDVFVREEGA